MLTLQVTNLGYIGVMGCLLSDLGSLSDLIFIALSFSDAVACEDVNHKPWL